MLRLSLLITVAGTLAGLGGSLVLSRLAALRLEGHQGLDLPALALTTLLMLLIATAMSLLPTRQALGVAPVEALRAE